MEDYYDMNTAAQEAKKNAQPTPCELAVENDKLKQKVAALCKERDEAHRQINQLVIRLNDETEKATRLEKERDAAIADLAASPNCEFCKRQNSEWCKGCAYPHVKWEWRGVHEHHFREVTKKEGE